MFDDFLNALEDDDFENGERPVELKEFVESSHYLGLPPLSDLQYQLVAAMTQIYNETTLKQLYGEVEGELRWRGTVNEVIAQLGKGSGKDYCSTIAVARIVYLLLCLKDPATYYGKPPGDAIDIINIAINAQQAKNVFFKGFKKRIDNCPWFAGKYSAKAEAIEFDKSVTCHSGHSERESWEGYNVLVVILDEISGFSVDSTSGNDQAKTAGAIYKMYRGSVMSRFPQFGKVILLSFPRYKGDFIQTRYEKVIGDKETIVKSHTFTLDDSVPEDAPGNQFEISWEEDEIHYYSEPKVFAMRRPTWEVNPLQSLEFLKSEFFSDPVDALSRFACMPPDAVDAFFKSREKIERAFSQYIHPFDEDWRFKESFRPKDEVEYFVHVDLAHKHDRAAVSMSHVEKWVEIKFMGFSEPAPVVVVDAIRWWTPKPNQAIDFADVRNYIVSLKQRGFNIKLVTFDQWQSIEMMNYLNSMGMPTERLSVAKKHYEDMSILVQEERLVGPVNDILIEELLQLRVIKGDKVDHPRKGSKDLSDAVCGSIHNAVKLSKRELNSEVEIQFLDAPNTKKTNNLPDDGVIRAPRKMPADISDFVSSMRVV